MVLLGYDAILAAGTIVMAARHRWPTLQIWSATASRSSRSSVGPAVHYTPAAVGSTEVFLTLFGALFTYAAIRAKRASGDEYAGVTALVLLTAPIAFHVASVANLQEQWLPLLVYLTCFSAAGVLASVRFDAPWLRLVVFGATALPLAAWVGDHAGPGWRLAPSVVMLAVYAMNLVAVGERLSREPDNWPKADVLLFHLNSLALFAGLYAIVDASRRGGRRSSRSRWPCGTAGSPGPSRSTSEEAGLNSLAMAFAMLGFAIGLKFDDWWAIVGWAVEVGRHRLGRPQVAARVDAPGRRAAVRASRSSTCSCWVLQGRRRGSARSSTPASAPRWRSSRSAFALALLHRREGAYLPDKADAGNGDALGRRQRVADPR